MRCASGRIGCSRRLSGSSSRGSSPARSAGGGDHAKHGGRGGCAQVEAAPPPASAVRLPRRAGENRCKNPTIRFDVPCPSKSLVQQHAGEKTFSHTRVNLFPMPPKRAPGVGFLGVSGRRAADNGRTTMKFLGLAGAAIAALIAAAPAVAQDLVMWERSGGNATVVERLVAAWNEKNPDRKIVLTYIPHTEMVPKLAQAIASGEVPDLMGLDLIYGPQFASAGQLEDVTSYFEGDPTLATASPGHIKVATYDGKLYGVPLYADVSALFWNKDLFRKAGLDPEVAADEPAGTPRHGRQDHRHRGRRLRLLPRGQLRGLQHLHLRPPDLGLGWQDRAARCQRRAARRRQHPEGPRVGPHDAQGRSHQSGQPGRERRDVRAAVRLGQGRHDGHGQLPDHARPSKRTPTWTSASRSCRVSSRARPPRSPAATSSPSPRVRSASPTQWTS